MDIKEFVDEGYLQEINRLILHPCGLALDVVISDDGKYQLYGVRDHRDDPEGVLFREDCDLLPKALNVAAAMTSKIEARMKASPNVNEEGIQRA
jgi:hypothetical protein